jgi:hypothetical protein
MIAEMFSNPDSKRIALASEGIRGSPLANARETPPIIMAEIPVAVKGTETKTKYDRTASSPPAKIKPHPSNVYELLKASTNAHHVTV